MNHLTKERSQEIIATEINSIKDQTRQMVLYNSIEIGKRLVEAKAIVAHGEWGNWLKQSVDYSQSTANNLMKIYEEYGDNQSTLFGGDATNESIASLPYTKALALLSIPNYEREEFIEEHNVHELSTRELDKVIKEKKELEKKLEIYEKEAEEYQELKGQIKSYEKNAEILEKKLEKAESNKDETLIKKLEAEKEAAAAESRKHKERIKLLEAELKEKPIEVPQVVERVPEEVKEELEDLRKKVAHSTSGESEAKFKYQFESLVTNFQALLKSLNDIQDKEISGKYKKAVAGLIDKMKNNL